MPSRILIFCGKGGVGKTTLSLAAALKHAAAGRRVLVVTSHPLPELSTAVSLEGLGAQYPAAVKNLFLVHLDARELLKEGVQRNFPVTAAAEQTARDAIFGNVVEMAPGLKPFYFLGRLQELAEREAPGGGPQYELLIWDAPAIGPFLSTLRSARSFTHQRSGPLAEVGASVSRFFSNKASITVLPVTTLEEVAVEDTVALVGALDRDFQWKGISLVLNMVTPVAGAGDARSDDPVLQFVVDRARIERERSESLDTLLGAPALAIPRLVHGGSDLALLGQIAGRFELPGTRMKITVYFGASGVGRTTMAAATALARARGGAKCLVLAANPGNRLRAVLGLQGGIHEQRIALGPAARGEFWAALPDVQGTLSKTVRSYARPADADRILRHPIYATFADSLSGMNELMAIERIGEFRRRGFEHIVIDTAPSRHALAILDKPAIFTDFAGSQWVKMMGRTYGVAEMMGMMAVGRKAFEAFSRVESLLGARLVREVLDFYSLFQPVAEGYEARARKTWELLKNPAVTELRMVSSPQKALRDAKFFSEALGNRGLTLSRVYVNRVWDREPVAQGRDGVEGEALEWYRCIRASRMREIAALRDAFEVQAIPEMDRDVDGLAGLDALADYADCSAASDS